MLKLVPSQTIEGVTVYSDDVAGDVFYALPEEPRFRIDENGIPVFKFIKYRLPIDREDGKKGGGFCFFDCEFTLTPEKEQAVKAQLQAQVDQRRSSAGLPPLTVRLGQPSYTEGTSSLLLSQFAGGPLIERVAGAGSPSLFGKNVSTFAVEFTPEGATVFEEAMKGHGGVVNVVYDLKFPVRLPPLTATAWFRAEQFYSFFQTITIDESFWGDDSYRETIREQFYDSESMGVTITPGFSVGEDTDKIVSQLRDSMQRSLDEAVERKMLEAITGVSEEGRKLPEGDFEQVTRDIQTHKISTFTNTYTENQVLEFAPKPQGALPAITSLPNVNVADHFIEIDADDPFFRTLNVGVQVNADFQELPIHSVEVHLGYHDRVGEFVFTNPNQPQRFEAFLEDGNKYKYWYQVNYKGESQTFKSDETSTDETQLVVNVDDLGIFDLDIVAGDLNFDQVKSAQVAVKYEGGREPIETQFTLTKDHTQHTLQKVTFERRRQAYEYKVTYFMSDGREFRTNWTREASRPLNVNDPFSSMKTIGLRAAGDLQTKIETIFVDLKYVDELNKYELPKSVALSAQRPFEDWVFPVISDAGKVIYTGQIRMRDGTVDEIPRTETTDSTILVGQLMEGKLQVQVLADLIDWTLVKLVTVSLEYRDEPNKIHEVKDFAFRQGQTAPFNWEVGLEDKDLVEYRWKAVFFFADGTQHDTGWSPPTSVRTIVLQPPGAVAPAPAPQPEPIPTPAPGG